MADSHLLGLSKRIKLWGLCGEVVKQKMAKEMASGDGGRRRLQETAGGDGLISRRQEAMKVKGART